MYIQILLIPQIIIIVWQLAAPLIDIGIRVPNISDSLGLNYYSIAPEIGAIENIDSNITLPVELISLVAKPINNQYIQVSWGPQQVN
jgi:hypothetical protein